MNKIITLSIICMLAVTTVQAQTDDTEILVSTRDIAAQEQGITAKKNIDEHFKSVWRRRGYINFLFATGGQSLTPTGDIPTSMTGELVDKKHSSLGVAFSFGRNNRLHNPIANMVSINLDVEGSLAFNYYDSTNGGYYNTDNKDAENNFIMPWNSKMYQGGLQMTIGPSVTVAPFTTLDVQELHFMKFNVYWHVGYNASLIYLDNNKDKNTATLYTNSNDLKDFNGTEKMLWGGSPVSTFGFNISWKTIGIGYEYWRTMGAMKYKSFSSSVFGSGGNKFKAHANRLYIQLRL